MDDFWSGSERRDEPPGHITVDAVSEQVMSRLNRLFLKAFFGSFMIVVVAVFGFGVWTNNLVRDIQQRPTDRVVQAMMDSILAPQLHIISEHALQIKGLTEVTRVNSRDIEILLRTRVRNE